MEKNNTTTNPQSSSLNFKELINRLDAINSSLDDLVMYCALVKSDLEKISSQTTNDSTNE